MDYSPCLVFDSPLDFPTFYFVSFNQRETVFSSRSLICRVMPLSMRTCRKIHANNPASFENVFRTIPANFIFPPKFFPRVPHSIPFPTRSTLPRNSTRPWKFRFFSPSLRSSPRSRALLDYFTGVYDTTMEIVYSLLFWTMLQWFNYQIRIILNDVLYRLLIFQI